MLTEIEILVFKNEHWKTGQTFFRLASSHCYAILKQYGNITHHVLFKY